MIKNYLNKTPLQFFENSNTPIKYQIPEIRRGKLVFATTSCQLCRIIHKTKSFNLVEPQLHSSSVS